MKSWRESGGGRATQLGRITWCQRGGRGLRAQAMLYNTMRAQSEIELDSKKKKGSFITSSHQVVFCTLLCDIPTNASLATAAQPWYHF